MLQDTNFHPYNRQVQAKMSRLSHRRVRTVLLGAVMAWMLPADGAGQAVNTRLYTTEDGLSVGMPTDVYRDDNGFLWVLGQQGIQRFDGHRFESFNRLVPDTLQRSLIGVPRFHVDPEGWVWLVEKNGRHALRFDPLTERTEVKVGPIVLPTKPDMQRICPYLYPFYDVLQPLGSPESLRKRVRELAGYEYRPWAFQRTRDGRIWLHRSDARIVPLGPATGPETPLRQPAAAQDRAISLSTGSFWLPRPDGSLQRIQLPHAELGHMVEFHDLDDAGGYWLMVGGHHLMYVDLQTGETIDHGKLVARASRVFRDTEGILWSCTEAGLLRLREPLPWFTPIAASPTSGVNAGKGRSIRGLVEESGARYLMFEDNGGMLRVDASGSITTMAARSPDGGTALVEGICKAANGTVWVISDGRLHAFVGDGPQLRPGPTVHGARITSLHASRSGDRCILFLENDSAVLFDPAAERLGGPFPLSKAQDAEVLLTGQRLYVPDSRGLRIVELGSMRVRTIDLRLSEPMLEKGVRGIVPAGHMLHIGTSNGILCVDTNTWRVIRHISEADGLADPVVFSLLGERDRLWVGTNNGLTLVDPNTGQCLNFRMEDGLPFNEFNTGPVLLDAGGRCWMGGQNGLVHFDPAEVSAIPRDGARLRPVQLRISDDRATTWTEHHTGLSQRITLRPHERTMSIAFALDKLTDPSAHRFSYYLEGLEPPWFNTGDRAEVSYHGLTPGDYRFRVKAFDHRGVAALNELDIPITVMQVWYLRKWAIALWLALLALITVVLLRQATRRRAKLAEAARVLELNAFKDRFFANVTHEFRTPITVIQGLAGQLGADTTAPAEVQGKAAVIQRNSQRLLGLVDQVLDLTRLEHGRLELDRRPGQLRAYLRRILRAHHSLAGVRGLRLDVEVTGDDVIVLYDAERLRQIADNLVGNALKFTPPAGVVTVRAIIASHVLCDLTLEVSDTGPGMAEADLPRIFDRFFQSESHDRIASGGTGIGLALVKELVDAMGGKVLVESELGKGACFTVKLSLEYAEPGQVAQPADEEQVPVSTQEPAPVAEARTFDGDRPVLLVVEDDPDVGDYIMDCVSAQHHVLRARDGDQGLAMAREHIPDLILSDVMMPGMDGFALCHALKGDALTSHIPVAMLTARSDQPSRLEGITRGADAYLVKPFDERELLAVLENLHRLQRNIQQRYQREWEERTAALEKAGSEGRETGPRSNGGPIPEDIEHVFLVQVRLVLEKHFADPDFGVEELAQALHLSRSQALRKIKALTGSTPVVLMRDFRLAKAQTLLEQGGHTVADVAYACGFNTPNYFSDVYFQAYGHRPSEHIKA